MNLDTREKPSAPSHCRSLRPSPCLRGRPLVFTSSAAGTPSPYCRTSGYRRGNGAGHRVGAVPRRRGLGRSPRLKIETQNVNVPACRFYQKTGCALGTSDRFAYPGQPGEVQLLWWKALTPPDTNSS